MKSVKYFGNKEIRVVDIEDAKIMRPKDVKIRIKYCGVCGSDLHTAKGEMDSFYNLTNGVALGHEACGVVAELGTEANSKGLKIGDRVIYYYNTHCGSCYYCRNGQEQFCENMENNFSAMSEYIVVNEQSVFKIPDELTMEKAVFIEPISVVLHGLDMLNLKAGARVAISGGGTMGMLFTMLCKQSGATDLTVIEPIAAKRDKALELGAKYVIDPASEDRLARTMEITEGRGFDAVIEASGSVRACDGIEKLVAKGGTLEFFAALYRADYNYPLNLLNAFFQEIHIIGGVMQSPYEFPRSIALAKELNLDKLYTDDCVFEPENARTAFDAQIEGKTIKSIIQF